MSLQDPNHRRVFIDDFLKSKGLFVPKATLTPEQLVCRTAMQIFDTVAKSVGRQLLGALKKPSDYNPKGTQQLLVDAFKTKFLVYDRDEAITLLAIMHAEELEKQLSQMAQAGHVGQDIDKKD